MHNNIITLSQLTYLYDKNEALLVNNLSIKNGITSVILGSNGSGKTTLLKILSGLLQPSGGTINKDSSDLKNNTIMVHQVPYLFSGTVNYNIDFGLKIKKLPLDKRKNIIKESLEQAGLFHLQRRKTSQLSGGEKHRLAIARAIAVDPEILILDEPFAHIDTESREVIEDLIKKRAEQKKTTILTTHDLSAAYRVADSIIYLENGKIKETEFNFLKGTVKTRDSHFCSFITSGENDTIKILAPVSDQNFNAAVIPFRDIFLSKNKIETSAQNQLRGNIVSLQNSGSQYIVTIDCGIELKAIITDLSVEEFKLKENEKIFVNFKASAVRLY